MNTELKSFEEIRQVSEKGNGLWSGIDTENDDVVVACSFEDFSNIFLISLENNHFEIKDGRIEFSML